MAWKIEVNTVNKTTSFDQKSGAEVNLRVGERPTARLTCIPGYEPDLFDEVVIYAQDGTTPIFGGLVFNRTLSGNGDLTFMEVDLVDFLVYLGWRTITHTFSGVHTVKTVAQLLVSILADYGFTLDAGQVDGLSADITGYTWTDKIIAEAADELTKYSGGYVLRSTPLKVLKFELPGAAPPAPFSIEDGDSNVRELEWDESAQAYATRVILRCGGTGTAEVTQSWTLTPTDFSNGYVETDVPSTPTGGVSITVNGTPRTIGGAGSELTWDWVTHRVTAGTLVLNVGDVLALTYTAQYPFRVVVDGAVTPPLEMVVEQPDLTTKPPADAMAAGLLARHFQIPRIFSFTTLDHGLMPGMAVDIDLTNRSTGVVTALVTDVTVRMVTDGFWVYDCKALVGVYIEDQLSYFRSLGGGTAPPSGFTTGINPIIVAGVGTPIYLGGSRQAFVDANPAAYTPVPGYVKFRATASFTGRVHVDVWAKNGGVSVTARLWDDTASASVGDTGAQTATTPQEESFLVAITAGHVYWLEALSSANSQPVYAIGTLESA